MLRLALTRGSAIGARVIRPSFRAPVSWQQRSFAASKKGENDLDEHQDPDEVDLSDITEPPGDHFEDETYGDDLDELVEKYESTLAKMKDYKDDDREAAIKELEVLKTEMKDEDRIISKDWFLNTENGVYYNPETEETKVPYDKSMKMFRKRRAENYRSELVTSANKGFPDFITPVQIDEKDSTAQLYTENEMGVIRKKYDYLDFKKLGKELDATDSSFFQHPPVPNLIRWGPELVQDSSNTVFQDTWDEESMKFLKMLPIKYHVATMRCVHGTSVGKKHSYASLVLGGNGKGWAGFGYGKGLTPDAATRRAAKDLRENLVDIPLDEGRTICQNIVGKHGRVKVILKRCQRGHGQIAGTIVACIAECFGILDISTKVVGSSRRNPLHVVYAAFKGLVQTVSPRELALQRGMNYYKTWDPATREKPPTQEQLKAKAMAIRNHIATANQQWRLRVDLSGGADDQVDPEKPTDDEDQKLPRGRNRN